MVTPLRLGEVAKNPGRVAGHDAVGGDIFGDHAAGAHQGILADGQVGQNGGPGADGCAAPHERGLYLPVLFALQDSGGGGGAGISVVDEDHAVADEDVVFDGHAFADKTVAGNLAATADAGVFLNLHKGAHSGPIADFAAVQVDEVGQAHFAAQLHVGRDAAVFGHR
jgi:hypothetical protein